MAVSKLSDAELSLWECGDILVFRRWARMKNLRGRRRFCGTGSRTPLLQAAECHNPRSFLNRRRRGTLENDSGKRRSPERWRMRLEHAGGAPGSRQKRRGNRWSARNRALHKATPPRGQAAGRTPCRLSPGRPAQTWHWRDRDRCRLPFWCAVRPNSDIVSKRV